MNMRLTVHELLMTSLKLLEGGNVFLCLFGVLSLFAVLLIDSLLSLLFLLDSLNLPLQALDVLLLLFLISEVLTYSHFDGSLVVSVDGPFFSGNESLLEVSLLLSADEDSSLAKLFNMVLFFPLNLLISPYELLLSSLHIALPLGLFFLLKLFEFLADAHFFFDLLDLLLSGLNEFLSHSLLVHKVITLSSIVSGIIHVTFLHYLGLRPPIVFLFLFLLLDLLDDFFLI